MCEPTVSSNAEVGHADVAPERGTVEIPSSNAAAEYWQTALQELCKNPPQQQHAYVANPLAPPPQAYGLWSGQLSPPLLTPYGPMPFFGGFFPSAYPIPTPPAAMPPVSMPAIKPEASEDGNTTEMSGEHQQQSRKRTKASATSRPAAASAPPLLMPQRPHPTAPLMDRNPTEEDMLVRMEEDSGKGVLCDDREMKKERRKQSNRESARRSRLRKQRECEALQKQVQDMTEWNQQLERENQQLKQRNAELVRENEELKSHWQQTTDA